MIFFSTFDNNSLKMTSTGWPAGCHRRYPGRTWQTSRRCPDDGGDGRDDGDQHADGDQDDGDGRPLAVQTIGFRDAFAGRPKDRSRASVVLCL